MRSSIWPCLLFLPLSAVAQVTATTPSVTLKVDGSDAGFANGQDCGSHIVTYSLTITTTPCSSFDSWITAGSCGNRPDAGDLTIGSVATGSIVSAPTGAFTFPVSSLPTLAACGSAVEINFAICGSFQYTSTLGCVTDAPFSQLLSAATFRYDAVAPPVPVLNDVVPLDSSLSLDVTTSADTSEVDVEIRPLPQSDAGVDPPWSSPIAFPVGIGQPIRVDNLTNDVTYQMRAAAKDGAGNASGFSDPLEGTPVALVGFWGNYKAAGGADTGGCSEVGGPALWALGIPALLALIRRLR